MSTVEPKIIEFNYFYFITDIIEHNQYKKILLNEIDNMPNVGFEDVNKTDWKLPSNFHREYLVYFYKMIHPYMEALRKKLKFEEWHIQNTWYQQYIKKDKHLWHCHNESNWSNIYYLELPKTTETLFFDTIKNETKRVEVVEGQLLTFPSSLIHCSPENNTDDRKTIISFNSDFNKVDLTI